MKNKNFEKELPEGYTLVQIVDATDKKLGLLMNFGEQLFGLLFASLRDLKQLGVLRLQRLNGILGGTQVKGCVLHGLFRRGQFSSQLFGIVKPQADVGALFVFHQLNGTLGLFSLLLQGAYLC